MSGSGGGETAWHTFSKVLCARGGGGYLSVVCVEEEDTSVCEREPAHILKSQSPSKFPLN